MFKGLVRIKCIDLANWAAMNNKLTDLPDGIRVSTEGMETLNLYPESSDTLEGLRANLAKVGLGPIANQSSNGIVRLSISNCIYSFSNVWRPVLMPFHRTTP